RSPLGDDLVRDGLGGQTPASVISPNRTDGVPTDEKKRRSLPTPVIPASISGNVDATVISRNGSPSAPPAIRRPVAPTENSPLMGVAPECTPLTSWIKTPPSARTSSSSNDSSPASRYKFDVPTPGVLL